MIATFDKKTTLEFTVLPPLYLPFYNEWGRNAYYKYDAFSFDMLSVRCSSTSGSQVVIAGDKFFGFMNMSGGSFAYDGRRTLTVTCEAGQTLYYNECCNPYAEWDNYSKMIIGDQKAETQDFWSGLEYCTWVEQHGWAQPKGIPSQDVLNEEFVYDYMRRVNKLGLPKGKLTIDDGWDFRTADDGKMMYGNWEPDRKKFPHMERLVKDMVDDGFTPGLWFAPFTVTPNSKLAKKHPELLGEYFSGGEEERRLTLLKPSPILEDYYTKVFTYYVEMGFKKFKLDMSYGNKRDMIELLKMMYGIIKKLDPTIEVESHIADIFASRYCDTVRINDVNFDLPDGWRAVTMEHYKVCRFSSPDKILNLDHLGTNSGTPAEENFASHVELLYSLEGGYPCVSLLPDRFSKPVCDMFVAKTLEWNEKNKANKK